MKWRSRLILLFAFRAAADPGIDLSKLLDRSHSFAETTVSWPSKNCFQNKRVWGMQPGAYLYASGRSATGEHGGAHLDSRIHFVPGLPTVGQIPMWQFIEPAIVVDGSGGSDLERDYQASLSDIANLRFPGIGPDTSRILFDHPPPVGAASPCRSIQA